MRQLQKPLLNAVMACWLSFCAFSTPALAATVIEFYNTILDNYFITADPNEAAAIDNGSAGPGWIRTGNTFLSGGSTFVCRFYGSLSPGPNSHFYTVDSGECQNLKDLQFSPNDPRRLTVKSWNFESLDFVSTPPGNGTCPAGTVPVYRAYNNGFARGVDSNHRITTNANAIQEVVSRGWHDEGVVMCAPAAALAANFSGTWSGATHDSSGPGSITFTLVQTGSSVDGAAVACNTLGCANGSVNGTVADTSSELHGTITADVFGVCHIVINFIASVSGQQMAGTYAGTNSCADPLDNGTFSLQKQ